jgi:hypothetical protein
MLPADLVQSMTHKSLGEHRTVPLTYMRPELVEPQVVIHRIPAISA